MPTNQKGTVRHRRLSLRPKSIWRTERLPSPCQTPQIPARLGKTSWLTARPVNATTLTSMPGQSTTRADPHAANARTHVGGRRTPLSHTHSLTHSVLSRPPPSPPKRRSSPYLLAQCAPRTAANTPAQQKALNDGTGPLIASLSRCGPAPQKQPLWTAWPQPTPSGGD